MAKKIDEDWYECSKCHSYFGAAGFYESRTCSNGLTTHCKECVKASRKPKSKLPAGDLEYLNAFAKRYS